MRLKRAQRAEMRGGGEEGARGRVEVLRHGTHAVPMRHARRVRAATHAVWRPTARLADCAYIYDGIFLC